MTITDTTTLLPLHPFQDDLNFLPPHDLLAKKESTLVVDLTTKPTNNPSASPPSSTLSSSSSSSSSFSSSPSSNSSTKASRLSLPSLWNNNTTNNDNLSTMESPCLPSTSSLWTYPLCSLSASLTDTKTTAQLGGGSFLPPQQGIRRSSLSHTPLPYMDLQQAGTKSQQQQQQQQQLYSQVNYQQTQQNLPLRNIWSTTPSVNHQQQQQSHQRRMSLSDFSASNCWSPLLTDSHHDTESTMDLIGGHGRRHSVAGPFMNKPLISSSKSALNGKRQDSDGRRPSFNDMAIDYTMNAINEDDSTSYFSTHYSRQQQHFLNRGVLEHIDEYFGGSTHGHVQNDSHLLSTGKPYSSGNYMDNDHQHSPLHYTTTTGGTMVPYYSNNTPHLNKAMTAGGDAASFGCSNVLMGKGIPLHHFLDSNTLLYIVEFKTSRTDICYIMQGDQVIPRIGDLVIIEADRGRDLGKVINVLTANDIMKNQNRPQQSRHLDAPVTSNDPPTNGTADDNVEGNNDTGNSLANGNDSVCGGSPLTSGGETTGAQKCHVKRLYRLANSEEKLSLTTKLLDEKKALMVCQAKIKQKELPMQVVDAEYQWDRRKLTFYFLADQRIDFRELVRELFKTYKTRIWMCAIKSDSNGGSTGQE